MVLKNNTLRKKILKCTVFLAIFTYLLISLNGYHAYVYSEKEKREMLITEQKLSINNKFKGIEKYIYILNSRIKEVEKYNESYPIFLLKLQKLIKDISVLNIEQGISLNVLNIEKNQVITSSQTLPKDYFFEEIFNVDPNNFKLNEVNILADNSEIAIIKSLGNSQKYKVILRIAKNLFFKTSREESSFFIKSKGKWIGLEDKEFKEKNEGIILDYREFDNTKFLLVLKRNFSKEMMGIFSWFILPIIPILVIYLGIYKLILKVFYNPLKKIVQISNKNASEDINIIDYLENTYFEIEKRNTFLSEQLKKSEENLKEAIIRKVILGLGRVEDLYEYYPDKNKKLQFGIISITSYEENIEDFLYKISKIAITLKSTFEMEVIPVNNGELFFINKNSIIKEELEGKILDLENEIQGINIFCFRSLKDYRIIDLENKYKEFSKNINYKEKFIAKVIIDEDDLKKLNSKYSYYYPVDIEQKSFLRINNLNLQGVLILFDDLFQENYVKRRLEGESLARFKKSVVNSLDRIIMQFELSYLIEKDFKLFFEKRDTLSSGEFKKQTFQILEKIVQKVKIIKGNNDDSIEMKMKKFIEDNYSREISLNEFAEYLGFTPQYASNLFKKINGENFNIFVNRYRIKKSIEIFNENKSQLKIKELAEKVGYTSSITYINNFKKIHKTSPGKYFGVLDI